jgi:hypothetical protein
VHRCRQTTQVLASDCPKTNAFERLMTDKLDNGDTNARKGCIRAIIDVVEVDDKPVRIIGSKDMTSCKPSLRTRHTAL